MGFLDCVCICQHDIDLKLQGIMHLAGFLRSSRELVILLDHLYFSRLWCVYELAMFRALNPSGSIRFLPLYLSDVLYQVHLYYFACAAGFLVMWGILPGGVMGFHIAAFIAMVPMYSISAKGGHDHAELVTHMSSSLDVFDVRLANITCETDRLKLESKISVMYGSLDVFNDMVRKDVKNSVLHELAGQRSPLPYKMLLFSSFLLLAFLRSAESGYVNCPLYMRISYYIFTTTLGFC